MIYMFYMYLRMNFLPQSLIREQSLPLHSSSLLPSPYQNAWFLLYNLLIRFYLLFVWLVLMSFPLEERSHTSMHLILPHPVFLVSSTPIGASVKLSWWWGVSEWGQKRDMRCDSLTQSQCIYQVLSIFLNKCLFICCKILGPFPESLNTYVHVYAQNR